MYAGSKRYYSRLPLRSRLSFIILMLGECFARLRRALLRCVTIFENQIYAPPGHAPLFRSIPKRLSFFIARCKPNLCIIAAGFCPRFRNFHAKSLVLLLRPTQKQSPWLKITTVLQRFFAKT